MTKTLKWMATMAVALAACGGGGGGEIEIEDVMEPCPTAGEVLPADMTACVADPAEDLVELVTVREYPDGCVVSRIGDPDDGALYAVPGETLTTDNPCEETS